MSQQTAEQIEAASTTWVNTIASKLFPGFIADDSLEGNTNGTMVRAYIQSQGWLVTPESLSAAVEANKLNLKFRIGFQPQLKPVDTRSPRQRAVDAGVTPFQAPEPGETSWAREIREGREANIARELMAKRDTLRYAETHQAVTGPDGRVDHAKSATANAAAAARHAQEDARESGRPVTVAKGFRVIPAAETDFTKYPVEELKAHLAKQKGGHLLR